ncbi:uncharacterized mitochondrial protein-like protein [Tanacetum coccineum]
MERMFDGKADEGLFVGYSTNSKAFRVFNSRTKIVEENLHVQFSKTTSNTARSGPNWLFDINALTNSMNYKPVVVGNHSNSNASTKACADAGKARVETVPGKDYILLPLWTQDLPFSSSPKDSPNAGFKPSGEEEMKDAEDPGNEGGNPSEEGERINQEKDASINNTNNINTVSPTINTASIEDNAVDENIVYRCANDPNIHDLEEISRFSDAEDDGAEADMTNLDTHILVYKNKKDESGIVIKNKERLVAQGYTQEEGIDYDEDFSLVSRIEAISDVKTASTPMETHKPLLKDADGKDVDEHLYRSMIGSLMYLTSSRPDIMFAVCAGAGFQVNPKVSHLHAVKRIFRYLKGQPKLCLWYPKDSPFDLVTYTDSDYTGASLDRKSTIGCLKNPIFHSKTKHIEIRHHFSRDSNEKKLIQMIKIHTDQNVAYFLTKAFDRIIYKGLLEWNAKATKDGIGVKTGNSRVNVAGHYLVLLGIT